MCNHSKISIYPHNTKSGRGFFHAHWGCDNKPCEFNDGAWLHKNITGYCYLKCEDCEEKAYLQGTVMGVTLRAWDPDSVSDEELTFMFRRMPKEE